ncbi:hypothetical protein EXIGLDRAFT_767924 [Exidia glandulosa HHB12029]|uniref:Uncharacterized protein n=1 Tax=Exidia glandulosa HHB12029 TaxID=1314781 RepID=A0A165IMP3_EXIGL|nr:hypothetical protein EXIGLDRAFT_767924 [Exidia glandulosa HHB12029]
MSSQRTDPPMTRASGSQADRDIASQQPIYVSRTRSEARFLGESNLADDVSSLPPLPESVTTDSQDGLVPIPVTPRTARRVPTTRPSEPASSSTAHPLPPAVQLPLPAVEMPGPQIVAPEDPVPVAIAQDMDDASASLRRSSPPATKGDEDSSSSPRAAHPLRMEGDTHSGDSSRESDAHPTVAPRSAEREVPRDDTAGRQRLGHAAHPSMPRPSAPSAPAVHVDTVPASMSSQSTPVTLTGWDLVNMFAARRSTSQPRMAAPLPVPPTPQATAPLVELLLSVDRVKLDALATLAQGIKRT